MNNRLSMMLDRYVPPIFGGIIILLVWEYVPALFRVSKLLLPSPSSVVGSLWLIYDRGLLVENFLITLLEALAGFACCSVRALFVSFLLTRSPLVPPLLMPYLFAFQAPPKVALSPLI